MRQINHLQLVKTLRGNLQVPISDGQGPAGGEEPNNPDFFVRSFPTSPLARQAADRIEELESHNLKMFNTLKKAQEIFQWYGDLHAAKPDEEKAKRNYEYAEEMRSALLP